MLAVRQKLLDYPKQSATDALKTASKRATQKTAEGTGDLIGNKITNKITKKSPKNISEPDSQTEEKSIEIPKISTKYISRKKTTNYRSSKINIT